MQSIQFWCVWTKLRASATAAAVRALALKNAAGWHGRRARCGRVETLKAKGLRRPVALTVALNLPASSRQSRAGRVGVGKVFGGA